MTAQTQLFAAAVLGTRAFCAGKPSAPALCADLQKMIAGRAIGQTPQGEAPTLAILRAYSDAWHMANLAAEVQP